MVQTEPLITLEKARANVAAQVELRGRDFVYRDRRGIFCRNNVLTPEQAASMEIGSGDPRLITGCLAGEAITACGTVFHHGHLAISSVIGLWQGHPTYFGSTRQDVTNYSPPMVVKYLSIVQRWQDAGYTWGEAYDRAEMFLHLNPREQEAVMREVVRLRDDLAG